MREVDAAGLLELSDDPWVRHDLPVERVRRAWVRGRAVVVQLRGGRAPSPQGALVAAAIGPPDDLDPLLGDVGRLWPDPWRVSVESTSAAALPAGWRPVTPHGWRWMTTSTPPDPADPAHPAAPVEDLHDLAELTAYADRVGRSDFAPPDAPDIAWVGVRRDGALVAVGGLTRHPSGAGHLRGIATAPEHRGTGLGRAVSAELTRRALDGDAGHAGPAVLGVFSHNEPALRVYRALGYRTRHAFVAGVTGPVT